MHPTRSLLADDDPTPIAVRSVDLSQPLHAVADVRDYAAVRLFLMWGGRPFASVDIPNRGQPISETRLRELVAQHCPPEILEAIRTEHAREDEGAAAGPGTLPAHVPVSIVVATYDRPEQLRNCLRSLTAQRSPRPVEIIVVDNDPISALTPPVVSSFPGVVLVNEPRRGLAYARNSGIIAARGEIVVCTDDDVTAPPTWVERLVAPFADREVMAVTGNILPLELETPAQRFYEMAGGLGRGFARRVRDGKWFERCRDAVPTWTLGATANAAFRATIFGDPQIGLMDEALGPGMPSGVGEDTYLFYKILKSGHTLVYEPAAYVWHSHRRNMADLRRQIYRYSKGHVAYHLTTLTRDHDWRALIRLLIRLPRWHVEQLSRWARACVRRRNRYPLSLVLLAIAGHLAGSWCLWRSRGRVKRQGRSGPYLPRAAGS